ncbi:putative ABC-type cobalamin/Fe3+-siderophores transport systems, periplasmic component [Erythrobacter sp. NAP1]|nr:putative ABC-type cobalamin/Fe3+-siderophores transport systems, periplasmic component [Erythrobacter sp. NAP1]
MGVSAINRAARWLGAASALAVLSGCQPAKAGRSDDIGPTFVSLNPCLDAILVEVAAPEQILALSHYSRDPAASSVDVNRARSFGVTGGTAEEIIALSPDIVLASRFIAPATLNALERAGLRVETFDSPFSSEASFDQIFQISNLAEHPARGDELVQQIRFSVDKPEGDAGSAMVWQAGQIVAGESSLVAEHLRWAGFSNHSAAQGLGQADFVTLEAVLTEPPDLLLIAGDAAGQGHPVLGSLEGTHVARFDPNLFYCGGPSIAQARERLVDIRAELEGASE